MSNLIPPLFFELASTTEVDQQVQKANAKLEAAMTKRKMLDLGAALAASLDNNPTVKQKNMESLIAKVISQKLDKKQKQVAKTAIKAAIKEAQKQSLGGGGTPSPQPKPQHSGEKQKKPSKESSFAPGTKPPPKKPQKDQSQNPNLDYQQFLQWKKNPYWKPNGTSTPPHNNWRGGQGNSRGRGPGRGHGRGGSNYGQGSARS